MYHNPCWRLGMEGFMLGLPMTTLSILWLTDRRAVSRHWRAEWDNGQAAGHVTQKPAGTVAGMSWESLKYIWSGAAGILVFKSLLWSESSVSLFLFLVRCQRAHLHLRSSKWHCLIFRTHFSAHSWRCRNWKELSVRKSTSWLKPRGLPSS